MSCETPVVRVVRQYKVSHRLLPPLLNSFVKTPSTKDESLSSMREEFFVMACVSFPALMKWISNRRVINEEKRKAVMIFFFCKSCPIL